MKVEMFPVLQEWEIRDVVTHRPIVYAANSDDARLIVNAINNLDPDQRRRDFEAFEAFIEEAPLGLLSGHGGALTKEYIRKKIAAYLASDPS